MDAHASLPAAAAQTEHGLRCLDCGLAAWNCCCEAYKLVCASTSQQNNTDDPQSAQQPPTTLDTLPIGVQATILHKAGPHMRQVCRAIHALHPLLALAPRNLPLNVPADVTAALATLPPSLTALDLCRLHPDCNIISTAQIAAICATLPALQCLFLPARDFNYLPPEAFTTLATLPHLHTISSRGPTLQGWTSPCRYGVWPIPQHLPLAARLRSLYLQRMPDSCLLAAPPAVLPNLAALTIRECANLAAVASFAPALRSLHVPGCIRATDSTTAGLAALTALTALTLAVTKAPPSYHPPENLLRHVAALTALRSLALDLHDWAPGHQETPAGWLPRLALLTHLTLQLQYVRMTGLLFAEDPRQAMADFLCAAAHSAAHHLPQLQHLALGCCGWFQWPSAAHLRYGTPHSFLRHLASATQLRSLRLQTLPLPASEAQLLSNLQRLSCVAIAAPAGATPPLYSSRWSAAPVDEQAEQPGHAAAAADTDQLPAAVAAMQLQAQVSHMAVDQHQDGAPTHGLAGCPGCLLPVLSTLTALRTLSLRSLDPGHDLAAVLQPLRGQLEWLDLGRLHPVHWPALEALGGMRQLRVLDLAPGDKGSLDKLALHLCWLPDSLQRCYLSRSVPRSCLGANQEAHAIEWLQARHPLVTFHFEWLRPLGPFAVDVFEGAVARWELGGSGSASAGT